MENPNLWGLKADKTKPLVVISLDVVVPKSRVEPNCWAWIAVRGWDLLQLRWEFPSSTVSPVWQLLSGDKAF